MDAAAVDADGTFLVSSMSFTYFAKKIQPFYIVSEYYIVIFIFIHHSRIIRQRRDGATGGFRARLSRAFGDGMTVRVAWKTPVAYCLFFSCGCGCGCGCCRRRRNAGEKKGAVNKAMR